MISSRPGRLRHQGSRSMLTRAPSRSPSLAANAITSGLIVAVHNTVTQGGPAAEDLLKLRWHKQSVATFGGEAEPVTTQGMPSGAAERSHHP